MIKAKPAVPMSSFRKLRKAVCLIEPLEPRAYLTGVVFGSPHSLDAAGAGIAPVFTNLDDMNGDAKADLIVASQASGAVGNSVSVLPGHGDGTFGAAQNVALDFAPTPIAEADLNGDGKLDVVAGSGSANKVGVILQNSNGTFPASATDYSLTGLTDAQAIAIGDFNGDGKPDIAVISYDPTNGTQSNFAVLLNSATTPGTFTLGQELSIPHTHMAAITAFTVGGVTDVAIANQDGNSVTILTNDGTGTFTIGTSYAVDVQPVSITSADFNNDGQPDLAVANSGSGDVSVLLGNGGGTFQPALNTPVPGGSPLKVRVSNLNNDGKPDLIMLLSQGSAADGAVMLGNGDGTFHTGTLVQTGGAHRVAVAAGDLNGDGLTDLVIADPSNVTSLLNITNQDVSAPTAAVDITQPMPMPGSAVIQFTVTYSDAFQVDASTLADANVTVTDPHGANHAATLVSRNLANGQSVTATYQINAPSGSLSQADDGAYTVTTTSNASAQVRNANGVPVAPGNIGTFNLLVPIAPPGPNLTAGAVQTKLPAAVVGGTRARGGSRLVVSNTGQTTAAGTIVINFYASPSPTGIPGNAPLLGSVSKKINLKPGKRVVVSLSRFNWPSNVNGTFYIVANVNATNVIQETSYKDNLGASATATKIAPPFVDVANQWNGALPALVPGKKVSLNVALGNNGNVPARGTATLNVIASPDANPADGTSVASVPVRVNIAPSKHATAHVRFTFPATLAHGTYHLIVTVAFPGDSNAANNTVASAATFVV